MPAKRYSIEQIMAKLREAEKHQAQGAGIRSRVSGWGSVIRRWGRGCAIIGVIMPGKSLPWSWVSALD